MDRLNFLYTFDVLVGAPPGQKRFTVHHDLATRRSDFFNAARSDRWTKDKQKPVDLTDEDPEVFSTYLQCLYTGEISLHKPKRVSEADDLGEPFDTNKPKPTTEDIEKQDAEEQFEALVELFVLADKLGDPESANLAIDEIMRLRDELEKLPSAAAIALAYASTPEKSPLRELFCDYYVFDSSSLPDGDFPNEFLRDVVREFMRMNVLEHDGEPFSYKPSSGSYILKKALSCKRQRCG